MILGIGTDIIEIQRIANVLDRQGDRLIKRILCEEEQQRWKQIQDPNQSIAFLAKRWCAKEAVAKALGTGIAKGVGFQNICIRNLPSGAPTVELLGSAQECFVSLGAKQIHLSISDEQHYALALCTISI